MFKKLRKNINMANFIEYTDNKDRYRKPKRKFENDIIDIRLYCEHKNCRQYIKGKEGYNGSFVAETGQHADLRNQCWKCIKHNN